MRLREFMHPAITCDARSSLADAARMMEGANVGSLVVTDGKRILGIVTDRDLAVRGYGHDRPGTTIIKDVMTKQVISVRDTADVFDAAAEIEHSGCRRLPVVDEAGNLEGIVALDDLAMLFAHQAGALAEAVVEASAPTPQD